MVGAPEDGGGAEAKLAVTMRSRSSATAQVGAVPAQSPPQPPNDDPAAGTAFNVTAVPLAYISLQSALQSIPAGVEVTVPVPVNCTLSVNRTGGGGGGRTTGRRAATAALLPNTATGAATVRPCIAWESGAAAEATAPQKPPTTTRSVSLTELSLNREPAVGTGLR